MYTFFYNVFVLVVAILIVLVIMFLLYLFVWWIVDCITGDKYL